MPYPPEMLEVMVLCPRCEHEHYLPYGWEENATPEQTEATEGYLDRLREARDAGDWSTPWPAPALSRMDNETYLCTACGNGEGMRDFVQAPPVPPDEWPTKED